MCGEGANLRALHCMRRQLEEGRVKGMAVIPVMVAGDEDGKVQDCHAVAMDILSAISEDGWQCLLQSASDRGVPLGNVLRAAWR